MICKIIAIPPSEIAGRSIPRLSILPTEIIVQLTRPFEPESKLQLTSRRDIPNLFD
jgi:hypothetical protein